MTHQEARDSALSGALPKRNTLRPDDSSSQHQTPTPYLEAGLSYEIAFLRAQQGRVIFRDGWPSGRHLIFVRDGEHSGLLWRATPISTTAKFALAVEDERAEDWVAMDWLAYQHYYYGRIAQLRQYFGNDSNQTFGIDPSTLNIAHIKIEQGVSCRIEGDTMTFVVADVAPATSQSEADDLVAQAETNAKRAVARDIKRALADPDDNYTLRSNFEDAIDALARELSLPDDSVKHLYGCLEELLAAKELVDLIKKENGNTVYVIESDHETYGCKTLKYYEGKWNVSDNDETEFLTDDLAEALRVLKGGI